MAEKSRLRRLDLPKTYLSGQHYVRLKTEVSCNLMALRDLPNLPSAYLDFTHVLTSRAVIGTDLGSSAFRERFRRRVERQSRPPIVRRGNTVIAGKHETSQVKSRPSSLITTQNTDTEKVQAAKVLAELYELLETYSPRWYTEEHHRRAQSALQRLGSV
ncbi:MAG: hypothetical protein DMG68_06720 [Acidobacteria bacterium]|nr:MAG: hypothetical protein DMG68_06720 [Acidobacteriota bacterium]